MTTVLEFRGKLKSDGSIKIQRIPLDKQEILNDPIKLHMAIQSALVQLGVGGMVHKEGDDLVLTPGEKFDEIRCTIPSILLASPGDSCITP